ncbi:MAG: DUF4097 family beta strand repeat protein [Clostridia bacterium]|nr:DUF4097 family beta strand repeat protein [Clostridia bacterium]
MKKWITLILAGVLSSSLVGCHRENVVLAEEKLFEVSAEIHSLDICINAADFKIEQGDNFSITSNLKYLSVSEKDGVLTIQDKAKGNANYSGATLTLCLPNDVVFNDVDITTGAAKMTVDTLSTQTLELKIGAGDVQFSSLTVLSEADIEGGAGEFTIVDGSMNDLSLEMGMGELNLTAVLLGNCDLEFGMGESNLTLLGERDNYKIDMEKGIGSISIDGQIVTNFSTSGNGQNHVKISGGVGAINLKFQN